MVLKKLLIFLFIVFPSLVHSEAKSPEATFWWSFFVPGGGYFYQGETGKGLAYFAATGGMVGWGLAKDNKRAGGEINAPFVYAQQIHATQIYLSYREALRKSWGAYGEQRKILQDRSTLGNLVLSPFKKENLANPWVVGFALLGAGINYAGARLEGVQMDFSNLSRVQILGDSFNRDRGFGFYSAYWIPISLGAGVSEESIFRGLLQTGWEESWGKTRGLMAASAVFGLAHYSGSGPSFTNALFAAGAGMYLGWRFQERNYHLSESIASHFWFDVLAGLTLYFADPDSNPLGAKVEFNF